MIAAIQDQCQCDQKCKRAVYDHLIADHWHTHFFCVIDAEFIIAVDRCFESGEAMYCLGECFYDIDTSDIFHCFIIHIFQCSLIMLHILLHLFAGHFCHACQTQYNRDQTDQSEPPVKYKQ